MKREELKSIIKIRSDWKINRQKGNYKLPSGKTLLEYVIELIDEQFRIDHLAIAKDGEIHHGYLTDDVSMYEIVLPDGSKEYCEYNIQANRIRQLALEIIC